MNLVAQLFFLIFVLIGSLTAYLFHSHFQILYNHIQIFLFLLIFSVGLNLKFSEMLLCLQRKKSLILSITFVKILLGSLVAFTILILIPTDRQYFVGIMILSIVPSAMTAAVISRINGGNVALNVVCTFIMLLIAPIMIPILSKIYLHHGFNVEIQSLFLSLLKSVTLPLILGMVLRKYLKVSYHSSISNMSLIFSIVAIILIVMGIVSVNYNRINVTLFGRGHLFLVILLYISINYYLGKLLSKLFKLTMHDQKAVCNELAMSDCALSGMLSSMFSVQSTLPAAFAAFWQIINVYILHLTDNIYHQLDYEQSDYEVQGHET